MKYKSFADMNCSLAQSLEVLGERWTLLILRDAFRGVRRFDEFLATGISRNILTTRLNNLIDHGILVKRPVDGRSADYLLTDKGLDLQPILLSFTHWGDKHMPHPRGPRLTFVEKSTGRPIREMSACSDNGRLLQARDIKAVPGPGMKSKE